MSNELQLDEIGYWSEIKLEIVRKYAVAYSRILSTRTWCRGHVYIDGFAGAGTHVSRTTGLDVEGSPAIAMNTSPPFSELHFVDLDGSRVAELERLSGNDERVHVHHGDCNIVLLRDVFPRCRREHYKRALCLLDPYGLNITWEVFKEAGRMGSVELFFNFMIMDANRNVFMRDPAKARPEAAAKMTALWGDETWRTAAYKQQPTLFGDVDQKATNEEIAEAFRERLEKVAGFAYVPNPIPMRNSHGAVIYYLYFASQDDTGARIVSDIFNRYRDKGAR